MKTLVKECVLGAHLLKAAPLRFKNDLFFVRGPLKTMLGDDSKGGGVQPLCRGFAA